MLHLVSAVIRPSQLDAVKAALGDAGALSVTVTDARGVGRQGGKTATYRGTEYTIDLIPKIKVEVVVASEDSERIAYVIADAARTGHIGDGKIWVTAVEHLIRIRTAEGGREAV